MQASMASGVVDIVSRGPRAALPAVGPAALPHGPPHLLCPTSSPPHTRTQCLIPEVPFTLHGEKGMFAYLEKVLNEKGHAVVCVAEGAGQVRRTPRAGQRPQTPMLPASLTGTCLHSKRGVGRRRRTLMPLRDSAVVRCATLAVVHFVAAAGRSLSPRPALPPAPCLGLCRTCWRRGR